MNKDQIDLLRKGNAALVYQHINELCDLAILALRDSLPEATPLHVQLLPGLQAALEIAKRYLPNESVRFLQNDIQDAITAAVAETVAHHNAVEQVPAQAAGGCIPAPATSEQSQEYSAEESERMDLDAARALLPKGYKIVQVAPAPHGETPETDAARLSIAERQRFARGEGVLYELVNASFAQRLELQRNAALARVKELEQLVTSLKNAINELFDGLECRPTCDGYGHAEDCPKISGINANKELRAKLAAARAETWEKAAQVAANVRNGYSAVIRISEDEQEFARDHDGPWVLNSDVAEALRAEAEKEKV